MREKFKEEKELIYDSLNLLSEIEDNSNNKKKIHKLKKEINSMNFNKEKVRMQLFDKIKELENEKDCSACSQLDGLSVDIVRSFNEKKLV